MLALFARAEAAAVGLEMNRNLRPIFRTTVHFWNRRMKWTAGFAPSLSGAFDSGSLRDFVASKIVRR
jgi:hypothetical protein